MNPKLIAEKIRRSGRRLNRKIFLNYMSLIVFLLVFLEITTYQIIQTSFNNANYDFAQAELGLKNQKLNDLVAEIDNLSKTIISDSEIVDLLNKENTNQAGLSPISHDLQYALSNNIDAVFLISNNGRVYRESDNELMNYVNEHMNEFIRQAQNSRGELLFSGSRFVNYATSDHGDYLFFAVRKMRSIDDFRTIGTMIIAIRESVLWNALNIGKEPGDFYVAAPDGSIVSASEKALIGTSLSDRLGSISLSNRQGSSQSSFYSTGKALVNLESNENTGWELVNAADKSKVNADFYAVQRVIFLIGIFAVLIALYFSSRISNNIARPLHHLIHSMQQVAGGDLSARTDLSLARNPTSEIVDLSDMFNHMAGELQTLVQTVREESAKEKDAELRALKAQINPHFLYNALDTVYWMLINKSDFETAEIVTRLGNIMRYSIKQSGTEVPVREEIQQIENYLFIQNARFEENLSYTIEIAPEILECTILCFILQPFIENAISHGLMHEKGKGQVNIRGFREGENLVFEIRDDGEGMTEQDLQKALRKKTTVDDKHTGLGISNVSERIKLFYGNDYGVVIRSEKGSGTTVTITLPRKL